MILIASTAIGFALARATIPSIYSDPGSAGIHARLLTGPSTCLVSAWAMALVVLRLRRPRPYRRRLVRQPGFVACTASLVGLLLGSVCGRIYFGITYYNLHGYNSFRSDDYWSWAIRPAGLVVLGASAGLWLAGRSLPERSWIDRMGRAIGVFWIAKVAFQLLVPILDLFVP